MRRDKSKDWWPVWLFLGLAGLFHMEPGGAGGEDIVWLFLAMAAIVALAVIRDHWHDSDRI